MLVAAHRTPSEEAARLRARLLREPAARYELRGMGGPGFGVPAREGHDDYLMSLALCAYVAATAPPPPVSGAIPPAEGDGARGGQRWWDRGPCGHGGIGQARSARGCWCARGGVGTAAAVLAGMAALAALEGDTGSDYERVCRWVVGADREAMGMLPRG